MDTYAQLVTDLKKLLIEQHGLPEAAFQQTIALVGAECRRACDTGKRLGREAEKSAQYMRAAEAAKAAAAAA